MVNPEFKQVDIGEPEEKPTTDLQKDQKKLKPVDIGELKEKIKETTEKKPTTKLQEDHEQIVQLMKYLEDPAPGMDKKLASDKEALYTQLDVPEEASMETLKLAYGQAVAAEKAINTSDEAKEAFKNAGVESSYRIARVAVEFNVLADEVGDIKEAKLSKMDMSEEAKAKVARFDKVNKEWGQIVDAMMEYVTDKSAFGGLRYDPKTVKVVSKRYQGEKSPAGITRIR